MPQLRQSMDEALQAGHRLIPTEAAGFNPLTIWIKLWAQMMTDVDAVLAQLSQSLAELRQSCLRTVFQLSLVTLHTQTMAQFAIELIDGVTVPGYDESARRTAIDALGRALADGYAATEQRVAANAALAAETAANVAFTHDLMDVPRQVIAHWQQVAAARPEAAASLPQVTQQVLRADESLALLDNLSQQISSIADDTPTSEVHQALGQVIQRVAGLLAGPSRR